MLSHRIQFHPVRAIQSLFGYHSVETKKRRTAPTAIRRSEDKELDLSDRATLIGTARENRRNQTLLGWIIRQHLDFVSSFTFQALTPDESFNRKLESMIAKRSRRGQWDVAQRHSRDSFLRLVEASRTVDGDIGILLVDGGALQGIEGDRITIPSRLDLPKDLQDLDWTHGVQCDATGRAQRYAICRRKMTGTTNRAGADGYVFDRVVDAKDFRLLGYFDRFDQVRGISPLASALNHLTDLYESLEYQLAKAKTHALFGTFIKRAATGDTDGFSYTDTATGAKPDASTTQYDYDLKWGVKIEGSPGDEIDTIESKTPSQEWQEFAQLEIRIALLALDIPFTFFDGRASSYSAQRVDLIRYQRAVEAKQAALIELLSEVTDWDIARWTLDKTLQIPRGMTVADIEYDWVPSGIPWIDKAREVTADMVAVSAGFQSRDDVIRRTSGRRFIDVVRRLAAEEKAAVAESATISIGQPGQISTRDEENI